MSTTARIFIDGEAGTTGLQIASRLDRRDDIELLRLDDAERKDAAARKARLNEADVAILCLPDAAAREAVAMIDNDSTCVIDASTAHRTQPGWAYGFTELDPNYRAELKSSKRIANPGCYALASVAMLRPLIANGVLPADWPVSINAVSGYSGGGKALIQRFEDATSDAAIESTLYDYALSLEHKHVPEITHWSGLKHAPIFTPSVGRYYKGMLVHLPLPLWALPAQPDVDALYDIYQAHYRDEPFVTVNAPDAVAGELDPEGLNGTNELRLHLLSNRARGHAVVVGQLDNLGKGASGQAVQTLNLVLGVEESTGL